MPKDSEVTDPERESDPEDEDLDEDEADAEEPSPRPRDRSPRRSKGRDEVLSEEEINSPKRQTLILLAVIAATTIVLWAAARFACNAHPPDSRRARPATTDQLARTPKGAAVELQQRWASHKLVEAQALAKGEVADQLQKEVIACEADLAACDRKREELEGKVTTMGEQMSGDPRSAKVKVKTTIGGQTQSFVMELEPDGALWKVVKRTPEQG